ncbi:ankyrin-3 isoform X33 [Panthera pardus]|uniref:Ankyrin 3 n=3 Tax=Panthera TaxID=9688 RepID=A0A8C8YAF9_PANLE|nr:ankyrin-3 isoform X2 [Panthera tigris]XP_019299809.1 ankyrin-3 isoform X33 [Panthera pardus]XP_042763409.1 ankyrin-3 isoform X2 [Panthera leo]XP_045293468.1 ankyrin-3 isoform X37 [Leopardus geoffroyi]XP_058552401.1 ankyrin-3 isoform X29 [Neofelis nebulosa]XP_060498715.1 ankyrin-3 isoform X40 [Panthera onca]
MALPQSEDAMTGDTDKYLGPQDLKELGDDSLPAEGYMGFSLGARSASLRSFSSDRSYTLNRSSYARDSMMIEELLVPSKEQHLTFTREFDSDSLRHYSWAADTLDNVNLVSSPVHSGFLVSFMVDARGGSMRGSRHHGMRIIIPPRKCTAPTRITCRLVKRHKLANPPPMVEGEGLASRLVEMGPAGAQFLGPVIVEIPHFGSMRGKERELIVLRSENGETWKEHQFDSKNEDLTELLNGMDEELDSPEELGKKRICRIITKDFPQYFAVVSRIKQESNQIGPEGGILSSTTVPLVQASFPEGALTKRIRVGLQAQPVPDEIVKKILGNKATFSPIVTVEPRRRKFHKPITMTIPVPPPSGEGVSNGYKGDTTPNLRLLCSITGGTSPAQWEDITGTTPLTFIKDCVSFTTNVSARFWLADCHQVLETVGLASQLYRELICVPYMAKFVVFAKMNDPVESSLRCFCMTDDKVDKTLEQQENFEEVARSKDIEVLEGKPIYVDCYGNLAPLTKGGQQLVFNFYAFKENRLPFSIKIRDTSQEPCGRLSFLKEPKTTKGLPQTAVCNLNITLPAHKKAEKADRRQSFASLALRKRYSYLTEPGMSPQSPCERTDIRMAIVADHLGLSWTELARELNFSVDEINQIRVENPNSLISQSFMLLKKWVTRDGKNATTDALTSVLTKINRIDIVTLLEGPIFDYGNISGTRSFADENNVFHDPVDGYPSLQVELETPTGLHYTPPTPFQQDDYFSDISSIESPLRTPSRLSDGLVPSQGNVEHSADGGPPVVTAEDTSLEDSKLEDSMPLTEMPGTVDVDESQLENVCLSWQNETSGGNLEPPAQARRLTGGLLERLDDSPDQCRDSITSYLKGEPGKFEANGSHAEVTPEAKTKSYFPESQNDIGKQSAKETLKPKIHGSGRVEEPASSLAAYQKALEETSKFVIEEPKPCVPVSMKKMSRTSPADGKPRLNLHEEEGSSGSEQKQGEGYKVKTAKKEIRHVEKKSHS